MATVNVNFDGFRRDIEQILLALKDEEKTLRPIAVELVGIMSQRIHENGIASDGTKIGQYKDSYLAERERRNAPRSKDVILILTNRLFSSWAAIATDRGWGVGFLAESAGNNVGSLKKIQYAEERFGKKIGEMTKEELDYVNVRLIEITSEVIKEAASGT